MLHLINKNTPTSPIYRQGRGRVVKNIAVVIGCLIAIALVVFGLPVITTQAG